jgi:Carboxypeptidase regulatory-like domain
MIGFARRRWIVAPILVMAFGLAWTAQAQAASGFTGTVSGGSPGEIEEVEVCVVEPGPSEKCTFPAADGSYTLLGLEAGAYQVEFLPSYRSHLVTQYYNRKAKLSEAIRVVVRGNGVTEGIDAELELGGEITGTATAAIGAMPLEEVEVCALGATNQTSVSCAHTNAFGEYSLPTIPTGLYRVGFWGGGPSARYAPQYYDEQLTFFDASPLSVTAGGTLTGIDAELDEGAAISGVVRSAAGAVLPGIGVCVLESSAASPARCTDSDGLGGYGFVGLPAGTYQVAFSPEFSEFASEEFALPEDDGYLTQYYDDVARRAEARALTLAAGGVADEIDAALLTPPPPLPAAPPPAVPITTVLPPAQVAEPAEPAPLKCKTGYVKKKVKGVAKCEKKAKAKPGKPKKKPHRKHPKEGAKPGRKGRGGHS